VVVGAPNGAKVKGACHPEFNGLGKIASRARAEGKGGLEVCIRATVGWTLVPGSGVLVQDEVANGAPGLGPKEETPDHFCQIFHIVRTDRGRSAGVTMHVEAKETRTVAR
jgi:hypothetical protein